jgi:hypothetical protein
MIANNLHRQAAHVNLSTEATESEISSLDFSAPVKANYQQPRWAKSDHRSGPGRTIKLKRGGMTSRVFRRLKRLELRNAPARGITSIPIRVLLVDAEKGVTGVLLLDGRNPTTSVPATAEEEASVREDLARRARAR